MVSLGEREPRGQEEWGGRCWKRENQILASNSTLIQPISQKTAAGHLSVVLVWVQDCYQLQGGAQEGEIYVIYSSVSHTVWCLWIPGGVILKLKFWFSRSGSGPQVLNIYGYWEGKPEEWLNTLDNSYTPGAYFFIHSTQVYWGLTMCQALQNQQ